MERKDKGKDYCGGHCVDLKDLFPKHHYKKPPSGGFLILNGEQNA